MVYSPGKVEAISYKAGKEISRASLVTAGKPAKLVVTPEQSVTNSAGHELVYVNIDVADSDGFVVNDAAIGLKAEVSGDGYLAGFGTGNPVTEEDYTDDKTVSFRGHALAIIRRTHAAGAITLTVSSDGLTPVRVDING